MQINVQYEAQVRRAIGLRLEKISVPDGSTVSDCVQRVAEVHSEKVGTILLNDSNDVQASLLMFLNDSQVLHDDAAILSEGDTLTLMTPISGG